MNLKKNNFTINIKGKLHEINSPWIMAIINLTPDSFFDGGKNPIHQLIGIVANAIEQGAKIIDIGGCSTRPGSKAPSLEEEWERVSEGIKIIRKSFPDAIISIDTFRSEIAKRAIESGADIINDISAGSIDHKMFETVAELKVPYILMHMQGVPENMQVNPHYENVIKDISLFFAEKLHQLKQLGVSDIIIDPGIGFGKALNHNYDILNHLNFFSSLGHPLLVGVSRKSVITKLLNVTPDEALNGSTVLHTWSILNGASILRVHDVKEAMECIKICNMLSKQGLFK